MNADFSAGTPPGRHGILIVDDHPIVREGLRELIENEPDFEIVGEAACVEEAVGALASTRPEVVIVDLSLKNSHGVDLIETIQSRGGDVKTLVFSMHDELLFAERTLRAGAWGYVSKLESADKVIDALRHILRGERYLSTRVVAYLASRNTPARDSAADPVDRLSNRELLVFQMLGQGLATKQIAARLSLSRKTIDTYRENIKLKLNLRDGSELVRHATRWVLENG